MNAKTNRVDMVNGPLWGKILKFASVFMLTSILQHLYSAADTVVVGRFAGEEALAGVGTCTAIINLFLTFILGFSAGTTIAIGQAIGAGDEKQIFKTSHTAMAIAILGGLIATTVCLIFPDPLLNMIEVPKNVMPEARIYLRVIAIGYIPSLIYNFGAAILRAKGDTKRALYIVLVSGVINVLLNLFFVCVLKMGAGGVAFATVISQIFTAIAVLHVLCHENDEVRIVLSQIRLYREPSLKILKLGLPSGIQSSIYSISNTLVQSSINGFGSAAIAGSSAVSSITNFYNASVNSFYQAAIVFVSQNFGAKKLGRIRNTMVICLVYVGAMWILQSMITFFCGDFLIRFYAPGDSAVVEMGLRKLKVVGYAYGLLGIMNVMSGVLRGMGETFINMLTSMVGVCGIRIVWIMTAFKMIGTYESLFVCYPLSWFGTFVLLYIVFEILYSRVKKKTIQTEEVQTE